MGLRGTKPTPTAILAGRGSRRAKARVGEPKPSLGSSPAPAWLSAGARKQYRNLARQLLATKVLTESDCVALALVAQNLDDYIQLRKEASGTCLPTGKVYAMNALVKIVMNGLAHFGMTPSSRANVRTAEPEGREDDIDEFFGNN